MQAPTTIFTQNVVLTSITALIPAGIVTSKLVSSSNRYKKMIIVVTQRHTTGGKISSNNHEYLQSKYIYCVVVEGVYIQSIVYIFKKPIYIYKTIYMKRETTKETCINYNTINFKM